MKELIFTLILICSCLQNIHAADGGELQYDSESGVDLSSMIYGREMVKQVNGIQIYCNAISSNNCDIGASKVVRSLDELKMYKIQKVIIRDDLGLGYTSGVNEVRVDFQGSMKKQLKQIFNGFSVSELEELNSLSDRFYQVVGKKLVCYSSVGYYDVVYGKNNCLRTVKEFLSKPVFDLIDENVASLYSIYGPEVFLIDDN